MGLEKEDIMALIAILQKGLTDDEPELQYEEDTPSPKPKKKSTKKTKDKTVNKVAVLPEKHMHQQDREIDKLLWGNNKPVPRGRPSPLLSVRCRICGKTEQVSSSLVDSPDRYKCNKCSACSG